MESNMTLPDGLGNYQWIYVVFFRLDGDDRTVMARFDNDSAGASDFRERIVKLLGEKNVMEVGRILEVRPVKISECN